MIKREMKQDARAISAFASKVLMRIRAAGDHMISHEDLMQELWIVWFKACESFDAEKGVPWGAYLTNGMRLYINRMVEKNVDRRHSEVIARSLDYSNPNDAEGGTLGDVIADDTPGIDEIFERIDHYNYILEKLNPEARAVITILAEQPQAMLEEVRRLNARSEYAKSRGITSFSNNYLTAAMVYDALGINRLQRAKINKHIQKTVERYGQR